MAENNTTDGNVNVDQKSLDIMADKFISDYRNGDIDAQHNMFS